MKTRTMIDEKFVGKIFLGKIGNLLCKERKITTNKDSADQKFFGEIND